MYTLSGRIKKHAFCTGVSYVTIFENACLKEAKEERVKASDCRITHSLNGWIMKHRIFHRSAIHFKVPAKLDRQTYDIYNSNDVVKIRKPLDDDGGDDPVLEEDLGEETYVNSQDEVGEREENSASEQEDEGTSHEDEGTSQEDEKKLFCSGKR